MKREDRSVEDLYDRTDNVSNPKDRVGPKKRQILSENMAESGICTMCSTPCSSCLHRTLSPVGSKVDRGSCLESNPTAETASSFTVVDRRSLREHEDQSSATSSHPSSSENAEREATIVRCNTLVAESSLVLDLPLSTGDPMRAIHHNAGSVARPISAELKFDPQKSGSSYRCEVQNVITRECGDDSCLTGMSPAQDKSINLKKKKRTVGSMSLGTSIGRNNTQFSSDGEDTSESRDCEPLHHRKRDNSKDQKNREFIQVPCNVTKKLRTKSSKSDTRGRLSRKEYGDIESSPMDINTKALVKSSSLKHSSELKDSARKLPVEDYATHLDQENDRCAKRRTGSSADVVCDGQYLYTGKCHDLQDTKNFLFETANKDSTPLQPEPQDLNQELENELVDVNVCDICGDSGRENLLATCSRCKDGAEHIYCMRIKLDKVPEGDWLCEECQLKDVVIKKITSSDKNPSSCVEQLMKVDEGSGGNTASKDFLVARTKCQVGFLHDGRKGPQNLVCTSSSSIPNVSQKNCNENVGKKLMEKNDCGRHTILSRENSLKSPRTVSLAPAADCRESSSLSVGSPRSLGRSFSFGNMPKSQLQLPSFRRLLSNQLSLDKPIQKRESEHVADGFCQNKSTKTILLRSNSSEQHVKNFTCTEKRNLQKFTKSASSKSMACVDYGKQNKPSAVSQGVKARYLKEMNALEASSTMAEHSDNSEDKKPFQMERTGTDVLKREKSALRMHHVSKTPRKEGEKQLDPHENTNLEYPKEPQCVPKFEVEVKPSTSDVVGEVKNGMHTSEDNCTCSDDAIKESLSIEKSSDVIPAGTPKQEEALANISNYASDDTNNILQDGCSQKCDIQLRDIVLPEDAFVWRGIFNVSRAGKCSETFEEMQAHLSTCVSPKVPTLVGCFPNQLHLVEASLASIWPIKFCDEEPREDNIALYFFPTNLESYERSYKILLQSMLLDNFALKGNILGVDLLIFPSDKLPKGSQRWNNLLFLWGVFLSKAQESSRELCEKGSFLSQMATCPDSLDKKTRAKELAEGHIITATSLSEGLSSDGVTLHENQDKSLCILSPVLKPECSSFSVEVLHCPPSSNTESIPKSLDLQPMKPSVASSSKDGRVLQVSATQDTSPDVCQPIVSCVDLERDVQERSTSHSTGLTYYEQRMAGSGSCLQKPENTMLKLVPPIYSRGVEVLNTSDKLKKVEEAGAKSPPIIADKVVHCDMVVDLNTEWIPGEESFEPPPTIGTLNLRRGSTSLWDSPVDLILVDDEPESSNETKSCNEVGNGRTILSVSSPLSLLEVNHPSGNNYKLHIEQQIGLQGAMAGGTDRGSGSNDLCLSYGNVVGNNAIDVIPSEDRRDSSPPGGHTVDLELGLGVKREDLLGFKDDVVPHWIRDGPELTLRLSTPSSSLQKQDAKIMREQARRSLLERPDMNASLFSPGGFGISE